MLEFVLETEIKHAINKVFGKKNVIYDTYNIYVQSPREKIKLGSNSLIYLLNEHLDIPTTARIFLISKTHIISTTKDSFTPELNIKYFRDYLEVITENYGVDFTPYTLTLLKISPYV